MKGMKTFNEILTAIDVFSRYLFVYNFTDASAIKVAKVVSGIMTKHAYLPTTLLTHKITAFTSTVIAEITQILAIRRNCATTKHLQTIGELERTYASLKTKLKKCKENRRQWHEYLPVAVLNHNTSYHASIRCEPTRVFHCRIPYNILDHKLGNNPNEQIILTTEYAEDIQNRTILLIDKTKQNVVHSHLKCKEYYDRKAKAAPLKENDYCFVLQPRADHQGSIMPFRDYRLVGPFIVQKVEVKLTLNANSTQSKRSYYIAIDSKITTGWENYLSARCFLQDKLGEDLGDQLQSRVNTPNPTYLSSDEQPITSNDEPRDADETESHTQ